MKFHGSYRAADVEFLLKPISIAMVEDTQLKERLIQSGQRHYSEMLTPEKLPSDAYRQLFEQAYQRHRAQMARDCLVLARQIVEHKGARPTLVSLARAGTPVGAVLRYLVEDLTGIAPPHYSISIIRDRGIDSNALDAILATGVDPASVVFIDGWTGKGVITEELRKSVTEYNASRGVQLPADLFVLVDLAGKAFCAASTEDYLIPSSILNSTISGLVSRSILNESIGPTDFHGCVLFSEFASHDISVWFVDDLVSLARSIHAPEGSSGGCSPAVLAQQAQRSDAIIRDEMARYGVTDRNLIKPGIGEATRVLLRRVPERVILRDRELGAVQHLLALAQEKGVPVEIRPTLSLNAISIIRSALDA